MNTTLGAIERFGFYSGLAAATATIAFVVVQTGQLLGVLRYPLDEILIYAASLCIVFPFLLAMLALHYTSRAEQRFFTHAALLFTLLYAVFAVSNYVVQLATVIPAKLSGSGADIAVLEQTPHSLFWDFDAIAYIAMGLATLTAMPAFADQGIERLARLSFLTHALVTPLIAFVYFYPTFSERLLLLGAPWAVTAPLAMVLLALSLRARGRRGAR